MSNTDNRIRSRLSVPDLLLLGGALLGSGVSAQVMAETSLNNLTVEYAKSPLGIDTQTPRFGWQMTSDEQNVMQTAYQIKVFDAQNQLLWDSGKVKSAAALGIALQGKPLLSSQQYHWQLSVWDDKNERVSATSQFETSFMPGDKQAWSGAKWIGVGADALPLAADYLPVYRLRSAFKLDKSSKSDTFALLWGANDPRLMNANKNITHLSAGHTQSYIKLQLDASALASGGKAKLQVYRVGYAKDDSAAKPLYQYELPHSVLNSSNLYQTHELNLSVVFGTLNLTFDGDNWTLPVKAPGSPWLTPGVNLNPRGQGSDYIAYPMLADVGFALPKGQKVQVSKFTIANYREPQNALYSLKMQKQPLGIFAKVKSAAVQPAGKGLLLDANKEALFVTVDPSRNAMPMLRSDFTASKPIASARLYATARGVYDAYINGKRVSEHYLNPGLTQYDKTQTYQTFDITKLLKTGKNAIGVRLGEGWWSGNQTFIGQAWNYFGDRQSFLGKIVITYTDGSTQEIVSDPAHWRTYSHGPLVYASLYQGEIYDASREKAVTGWSEANFNAANWQPAKVIDTQNTTYNQAKTFYFGKMKLMEWPKFQPFASAKLISQYNDSVQAVQTLSAKSVHEVRPGVYVYDFGQNFAGVPQIDIKNGVAGETMTVRYAETLYPDLPQYKGLAGMILTENLRGALAQDKYTLKGGAETFSPRFTYHGFRYIEISGLKKALPLTAVKGVALSSVHHLDSHIATSNAGINKLWNNITWSLRSNYLSIPTDCPQRNERMGWSGDLSVFTPTANFLTNQPAFLRRQLRALRDTQSAAGRFDDVAPIGGGFGGILWGSAGITVAWQNYLQYGDMATLQEHFDAMQRYMDYLHTTGAKKAGFLGDWLSPEGSQMGGNPANYLIWDAYYAYDLQLMEKVSAATGHQQLAQQYAKDYAQQKAYFNRTYIDSKTQQTLDPASGKVIGSEASYVIPLGLGVVSDANKAGVAQRLVQHIEHPAKDASGAERPAYSLMTGFIGTALISQTLTDIGRSDIAYKMLENNQYPSWLYSVDQGATTIWERLNSYTKDKGFNGNNSMNSFNHYSFGSVGAWMYQSMLGIVCDPSAPAFKHFTLAPHISPTLTHAGGYYDSLYGRIVSRWQIKDKTLTYTFAIPANTSATVYFPAASKAHVALNGKALSHGMVKNGHIKLELGSGQYTLTAPFSNH